MACLSLVNVRLQQPPKQELQRLVAQECMPELVVSQRAEVQPLGLVKVQLQGRAEVQVEQVAMAAKQVELVGAQERAEVQVTVAAEV